MAGLGLRINKYPAILHVDRDFSEKKLKRNVGLDRAYASCSEKEETVTFARFEIYLGCEMEKSSKALEMM